MIKSVLRICTGEYADAQFETVITRILKHVSNNFSFTISTWGTPVGETNFVLSKSSPIPYWDSLQRKNLLPPREANSFLDEKPIIFEEFCFAHSFEELIYHYLFYLKIRVIKIVSLYKKKNGSQNPRCTNITCRIYFVILPMNSN